MLNFLYCFDSNYNNQAFSSMISLLDRIDEKINIFVVHSNQSTPEFIPEDIRNHLNINLLTVKKFKFDKLVFPNLSNSHVTSATYYRLFIDDYFSKDLEFVIYIDSDIICINNPLELIKSEIIKLKNSNYSFGACSEPNLLKEKLDSLQMKSNSYFNAGFMIINLPLWKRTGLTKRILNLINSDKINFEFWDQDLLNHFFDGRYLEINSSLNWQIQLDTEISKNDVNLVNSNKFIHFSGNKKPWAGEGLFMINSEFYQREFRKISDYFYHIEHKWKPSSLKYFILSLLNGKFFSLSFKSKFLKLFVASFFLRKISK